AASGRRLVGSPATLLAQQFAAKFAERAPHGIGRGGEVHDVAGALGVVGDVGGEDTDDVGVVVVDADVRVDARSTEPEGGQVHPGRADGDVPECVIEYGVVAVPADAGVAVGYRDGQQRVEHDANMVVTHR